MFKSDSIIKLAPALVKAQMKMGVALKDSSNPFYKSRYADLNAVIDACMPALNSEGITVLQIPDVITLGSGTTIPVIQTMLVHESGEYIASNTQIICAKQNDPQALGSATTYARRYGLQSMITLTADDDDSERAMDRTPTKSVTPQKERIDEVLQGPTTQSSFGNGIEVKKSSFKRSPQQQGLSNK